MNPMYETHDEHTIIAQCTPTGSGAIALLRVSGNRALDIVNSCARLASQQSLVTVPSHTIHYGSLVDLNDEALDHVLFLVMHGPKTFTGQHTVEITCHNNPFIIESVIDTIIAHGARLAQEGEFTKRAVLNNKLDIVQAEAINELIHANSKYALQQSLAQLDGSFSQWISAIEKKLLFCTALSEASFEFIDEDMEFADQVRSIISELITTINDVQKTFNIQQQLREGIRIALIGSVNAGKSSLFNALLNKQRSIVTNIAGTTRDSIEASMYRNNIYMTLVDTAGLRQTEDVIEQEGIQRSFQEAHKADIVLLIIDGSAESTAQEQKLYQQLFDQYSHKIITVVTKSDLQQKKSLKTLLLDSNVLQVSSTTKHNLDLLENSINQKITALTAQLDTPFILNKRQFQLLSTLKQQLITINESIKDHIEYELLSFHLKEALEQLSELSGKTISENSMNAIFREFCIGK